MRPSALLATLLACGGGPAAADLELSCQVGAPLEPTVELKLGVAGCEVEPVGGLTLAHAHRGRFTLVSQDTPDLAALQSCLDGEHEVLLWALPGGASGCGLPVGRPEHLERVDVVLDTPLSFESGPDRLRVTGPLSVELR